MGQDQQSMRYMKFSLFCRADTLQGMIKMYNAEVLSKFPVVQHFPFGSLFAWENDPSAKSIQASVHTSSQPKSSTVPSSTSSTSAYSSPRTQPHLREPVGRSSSSMSAPQRVQTPLRDPLARTRFVATAAPWARPASALYPEVGPDIPDGPNQPTRAPWSNRAPAASAAPAAPAPPTCAGGAVGTTAPWAGRDVTVGRGAPLGKEGGTWAPRAQRKPQ